MGLELLRRRPNKQHHRRKSHQIRRVRFGFIGSFMSLTGVDSPKASRFGKGSSVPQMFRMLGVSATSAAGSVRTRRAFASLCKKG